MDRPWTTYFFGSLHKNLFFTLLSLQLTELEQRVVEAETRAEDAEDKVRRPRAKKIRVLIAKMPANFLRMPRCSRHPPCSGRSSWAQCTYISSFHPMHSICRKVFCYLVLILNETKAPNSWLKATLKRLEVNLLVSLLTVSLSVAFPFSTRKAPRKEGRGRKERQQSGKTQSLGSCRCCRRCNWRITRQVQEEGKKDPSYSFIFQYIVCTELESR